MGLGEKGRRKRVREREEWRGVCDGWDCALPEAFYFLTPSDLQLWVLSGPFLYI